MDNTYHNIHLPVAIVYSTFNCFCSGCKHYHRPDMQAAYLFSALPNMPHKHIQYQG